MLPALCPDPRPQQPVQAHSPHGDTVFNLHPYAAIDLQTTARLPERAGLEEFPHLPHTGPTPAHTPHLHCSFTSESHLGCHSTSGILGGDSVGTQCPTYSLHGGLSSVSL